MESAGSPVKTLGIANTRRPPRGQGWGCGTRPGPGILWSRQRVHRGHGISVVKPEVHDRGQSKFSFLLLGRQDPGLGSSLLCLGLRMLPTAALPQASGVVTGIRTTRTVRSVQCCPWGGRESLQSSSICYRPRTGCTGGELTEAELAQVCRRPGTGQSHP